MESKSKLKRDLSSKDIRLKRKAVRQLFEIGEVWILELFCCQTTTFGFNLKL